MKFSFTHLKLRTYLLFTHILFTHTLWGQVNIFSDKESNTSIGSLKIDKVASNEEKIVFDGAFPVYKKKVAEYYKNLKEEKKDKLPNEATVTAYLNGQYISSNKIYFKEEFSGGSKQSAGFLKSFFTDSENKLSPNNLTDESQIVLIITYTDAADLITNDTLKISNIKAKELPASPKTEGEIPDYDDIEDRFSLGYSKIKNKASAFSEIEYMKYALILKELSHTIKKNAENTFAFKNDSLRKEFYNGNLTIELFEVEKNRLDEAYNLEVAKYNLVMNKSMQDYNNSKNEKRIYFPIIDWKYKENKTELTELVFSNQLSNKKFKVLRSTVFNIDPKGGASIYSEIVSSYIGFGKISISGLLNNDNQSSDTIPTTIVEKQDDAIQRLIGGGGNIGLSYSIPWVSGTMGRFFRFGSVMTIPRIGVELPIVSKTIDNPSFQYEFSNESFFTLATNKKNIGLFGNYKMAIVSGESKFQKIIENNSIFFHQITLGIVINETFRVGLNLFRGSDFVKKNFPKATLSLSIIPD